jgi:hypothetical protein
MYKEVRTGPDEKVTVTPTEEVEFCDACGFEMPPDVYPRFDLDIEHYEHPHYEDENSRSTFSLCSPGCVLKRAELSEPVVFSDNRRHAEAVEDVRKEERVKRAMVLRIKR